MAGQMAFDWMEGSVRRRRFVGGLEFGPGGIGRPVQIADDRDRQYQQNENFHQQGSNDRRPKTAMIGWALAGG